MDALKSSYLDNLLYGQGQIPASRLSWLNELRAEALERANALTVPTTGDEDWRFTDLSPLYKTALRPSPDAVEIAASALEPWLISEAGSRLVFVDGAFAPNLSVLQPEDGVAVLPLASALTQHGERVRAHLAQVAPFGADPFCAVNTAWLRDGAAVLTDRNRDIARPIHLLFLSASPGAAVYPRALIVTARGSRCTVVEDFLSSHEDAGFTNGVTEVVVGENASEVRSYGEKTHSQHPRRGK